MRPWGWRWYLTLLLGRDGGAEAALAHLPLCPGQYVLVVGAAQVHALPTLRDRVGPSGRVTLADPDWTRLLNARRYCRGRSRAIQVRQERLTASKLPPGRYDLVCAWEPPQQPWPALLAAVAGALRPGGIFSVTLLWPGKGALLRPALIRLAVRAGLSPLHCWGSAWNYTVHLQKPGPPRET